MMEGKKILVIIPKYFGYEIEINKQLNELGATTYIIFENLDNFSYKYRFIKNYIPFLFKKSVHEYFIREINKLPLDIDQVLVIRGEFLDDVILRYMKKRFPARCKFSMYQWDSVKNNPNAAIIASAFDRVSTFDKEDAVNNGWVYRPLFFIDQYIGQKKNKDVDILFMGSLHSDRVEILNFLKSYCNEKRLKLDSHIFSKMIIYYKRKYINRRAGYVAANDADIKFTSLSLYKCYQKYNNSRVVVDYTHPGQKGYTMRTIECLGCGCKLITNNIQVLKADFYDPDNIIVYDGKSFEVREDFFATDYRTLPDDTVNKYSIRTWLLDILQ